jgi:hypothetical protein
MCLMPPSPFLARVQAEHMRPIVPTSHDDAPLSELLAELLLSGEQPCPPEPPTASPFRQFRQAFQQDTCVRANTTPVGWDTVPSWDNHAGLGYVRSCPIQRLQTSPTCSLLRGTRRSVTSSQHRRFVTSLGSVFARQRHFLAQRTPAGSASSSQKLNIPAYSLVSARSP